MAWIKRASSLLLTSLLGFVIVGSVALVWSQARRQAQEGTQQPVNTPTAVLHQAETPDIPDDVRAVIETTVQQFPALYPSWADAHDEPFLVYDRNGQPAYWKILLRRDEYIVGAADVDVETGEIVRFGEFGKPLRHFPDPPTAEEALEQAQDFLSQYTDVTIDKPFFCGPDRESWLILVRRDGEIIARVGVWGDEVWDEEKRYGLS